MDFFDLYARAVLAEARVGPGSYTSEQLNALVYAYPPAEAHGRAMGFDLRTLCVVDTNEDLEEYIAANFFGELQHSGSFTPVPALFSKHLVANAETYQAWQELMAFAGPLQLAPIMLFHNNPFRRGELLVYPADMRLGFNAGYIWDGLKLLDAL